MSSHSIHCLVGKYVACLLVCYHSILQLSQIMNNDLLRKENLIKKCLVKQSFYLQLYTKLHCLLITTFIQNP